MNEENVQNIVFFSNILNKEMGISIYLPKAYYEDKKTLPVLYFMHGRSGNESLLTALKLNKLADKMIKENKINPLIIVCPRIENSRGINSSKECKAIKSQDERFPDVNIGMYEDYFIKEVIPLIDNKFNTIKEKEGRFIGGISGGGYAALHLAFRHQDMFSKVGGHMPAIELELEEDDKPFFKDMSVWEKYDPISIAKNIEISKNLKIYLDDGNQDEGHFYVGCEMLQKVLEAKNATSENHIFEGHHNGVYVFSNLEKYLVFYSEK